MVSQAELILRVITLWFLVLCQFFRDGMGPFNKKVSKTLGDLDLDPTMTIIKLSCFPLIQHTCIKFHVPRSIMFQSSEHKHRHTNGVT